MAGQELKLAFANIHPVEADARYKRAVGDAEVVAPAGAEKVELVVADEVGALPGAIHAEANARVLRAEAEFRKLGGRGVIIRYAAEIAAERPAGILVFPG